VCFAIGMSEPGSGSDLFAAKTKATKVQGGWLINGSKIWTSNAHIADYMLGLFRTAPPAKDNRRHGLTQFLVDMRTSGIQVNPIYQMTGQHDFNEVLFADAFIPDDHVLGEIDGAWKQATSELAYERSGPERFLETFYVLIELVRALGPTPDLRSAEGLGRLVADDLARRIQAGRIFRHESGRETVGFLLELMKQAVEIIAREGPLEGLGGFLVVLLEPHQLFSKRGEVRKIVGRQQLALDDGEIDLDLVEPTGVDRSMDEDDIGPFGAQSSSSALAAMRGAVVDDPEHAAGRPVRLLAHDLRDQAFEGSDAGFSLASAEQLGVADVPRSDVGPRAGPSIFVFDVKRAPRSGRQWWMFAPACLDARLLVGAEHKIKRPQGFVVPPTLIQVQDAASLDGKSGVAGEDPAAMAPRSQRVLAEPAPQRGAADLRHQPLRDGLPAQFGKRPARQWQPATRRQLTSQRLDLDPDRRGKNEPDGRRVRDLRGRIIDECRNVYAIC
jgi:hypothetical protein